MQSFLHAILAMTRGAERTRNSSDSFSHDLLCGKPWESEKSYPDKLYSPLGMLGAEERRFLHWLTRFDYQGRGQIVDAGSYIGASSFALASGLAQSKHRSPATFVHCYDYFFAVDDYVIKAISRDIHPIQRGDSYLDIFQRQIEPYSELIKIHPGDFLQHAWTDEPVEVLFIDIAKSQPLNDHLLRNFFPHLIPGRSVVIQQDFYHCWHPYIHATMEALAEYFSTVDDLVQHQSRVYRLSKPIDHGALEQVLSAQFTPADQLRFLDRLVAREQGDARAMAQVVRLCHLLQHDPERFDRDIESFWPAWPTSPRSLWYVQARELQSHRKRASR